MKQSSYFEIVGKDRMTENDECESRRIITDELPRDDTGCTYIPDSMIAEYPHINEFLKRTGNSWFRDELGQRYVLFPSVNAMYHGSTEA